MCNLHDGELSWANTLGRSTRTPPTYTFNGTWGQAMTVFISNITFIMISTESFWKCYPWLMHFPSESIWKRNKSKYTWQYFMKKITYFKHVIPPAWRHICLLFIQKEVVSFRFDSKSSSIFNTYFIFMLLMFAHKVIYRSFNNLFYSMLSTQ